ncbi:hypothetical protein FHG87_023021 [Trinorchestia longiramus]|nr:hypothetical protein FHG87_023021 [Trinorchestia longiramus]
MRFHFGPQLGDKERVYVDQSVNKTTEVNTVMRLGTVSTGSTTLTNKRSRSCSRAQPTTHYKDAATLCVTQSLPSPSKFNISIKNSHQLKNSTCSQQQGERRRNHRSCLRTGWGSNNPHTTRSACATTPHTL